MTAQRPPELTEDDLAPLLQATASRSLDTCLRGARGLAVLGDPRAFGLLLQLSREDDAAARVEVCRALAVLDDPRSVKRLRSLLYDPEAAVRDAAFSALAHIYQNEPLLAAESGLNAAFEDVRRRGLQALISAARAAPPTRADEPAWQLLVRALNDSFESVRGEAFKAALNLQIGGGVQTLRFVLQSIHADVRREVLTEVMAQANEPWAWNLLLEFYNDHDPRLREEAFAFAVKKTKELPPLEAGLRSQYADVRKQSVQALVKKHTPEAQQLLVRALADPEKEVRQLALESLVGSDAQAALVEALRSPHADVRVRAAGAMARHGAREALAPLLDLATVPEPKESEPRQEWEELATLALAGLAQLGNVAALPHVLPLLNSPHAAVRKNAAFALAWVAVPQHVEALRQVLQHPDANVKYQAALGLAYSADPVVASLVFSQQAAQVLSAGERLVAAFALGAAGEEQLVVFLDDPDEKLRNWALLLLMLREAKDIRGTAACCLACLSSRMPRVRLTAAGALERYADPAAFSNFVVQLFNDRGDEPAWKIPPETVATVADLLAYAAAQTRVRTAQLLRYLSEKEQTAWDQAWSIHAGRFGPEIGAIREQAQQPRPVRRQYPAEELRQLAFGAYVGLVREQGGQRAVPLAQIIRVRQTALARVLALAQPEERSKRAAIPVFVQALGDPNQAVRVQAFEHLQALGMDGAALGIEALSTGHTDLGVKAMQVLTRTASASQAQALLEQAVLRRKDDLALEAAKLLIAQRGVTAVAVKALEAAHAPMRQQAVAWLAAEYDRDPAAQKALRAALESRYQAAREAAALELGTKKDPAAFEALVKLLHAAQEPARQRRAIQALVALGDRQAPDAFLDRVENDPSGTAVADALFEAAGSGRRPENVERLLRLGAQPKWEKALRAVYVISGFDQRIADREDESPDRTWEERQHPRHPAVLARLMEQHLQAGATKALVGLVPDARWARGPEVDPVLALLTTHADDKLRQATVEAIGWRLRKRGGPAEPLTRLLGHREPVTQFLAAEGLAKAGRAEGINVLLAAVDFMSDLRLRQRAVRALGELADARALDVLLRLANEPGHALQEDAAEAIGHLGRSPQAGEIFTLLERFARGNDGVAENALKGLRWLNTHAGWQLVRRRAADRSCPFRETAVDLLGYNDDPATRDLFLRLLADDWDPGVVQYAIASARRLWGPESLEPDYALLQNAAVEPDEDLEESLKRVCERGEPRRIFEVLPRAGPARQEPLATSLLSRPALPLVEAQACISNTDVRTVQVAGQVLGRAGPQAAAAGPALAAALQKWREIWEQRRREMVQTGQTEEVTPCVRTLLWAAGRLGVARDVLLAAAGDRADDPLYRPIRLEAVMALAAGPMTPPVLDALEAAAVGSDPEVRALAAEAVGRHGPQRAARLAERLLADRVSFDRLTAGEGVEVSGTVRAAAGQVHYQGVALPHLIAHRDVESLAAVAQNRQLPEATRLGAVEGLAVMATEAAETKLRTVGLAEKEDEELRKAAWRALRRCKRARRRQQVTAEGA